MDLIRVKLGARNSGLHNSGECDQNKGNWTPGSQMTRYGSFWVGFKNLILNEKQSIMDILIQNSQKQNCSGAPSKLLIHSNDLMDQ